MYLRGARTPNKLIHVVTGGGVTMPPRHAIPMRPSGVSSRRDAVQGTQIQLDRMVVRIIRGGAVSILYGHIHGPRPILATTS